MGEEPRSFRTFRSREEAVELMATLEQLGFDAELEDNSKLVSSTFVGDVPDYFHVKLAPADFLPAERALEEEAEHDLAEVDKDHYLFNFTDQELTGVVMKADEWNAFDRRLAKRILAERGMPIPEQLIESIRTQRMEDLRRTAPSQTPFVVVGYIAALLGGLIGLAIGYYLNTVKKTLPDGERVYVYHEHDRRQGKRIFFFGSIMFVVWMAVRLVTLPG